MMGTAHVHSIISRGERERERDRSVMAYLIDENGRRLYVARATGSFLFLFEIARVKGAISLV